MLDILHGMLFADGRYITWVGSSLGCSFKCTREPRAVCKPYVTWIGKETCMYIFDMLLLINGYNTNIGFYAELTDLLSNVSIACMQSCETRVRSSQAAQYFHYL